MKNLCVGGSFNPIHFAHLRCAEAIARVRSFDHVVLIPSAQPPHKTVSDDLASPADRLAMCKLAADWMNTPGQSEAPPRMATPDPGRREYALPRREITFAVDDLELRRAGPSYTIDTAIELKQRGWTNVSWMIGADMLMYLPKWHRSADLLREVDFVIVNRPGWVIDWSALPQAFQSLQANVVEAPLLDISATQVRQRIKAGQSLAGLTPEPVIAYIEAKGLYR